MVIFPHSRFSFHLSALAGWPSKQENWNIWGHEGKMLSYAGKDEIKKTRTVDKQRKRWWLTKQTSSNCSVDRNQFFFKKNIFVPSLRVRIPEFLSLPTLIAQLYHYLATVVQGTSCNHISKLCTYFPVDLIPLSPHLSAPLYPFQGW